MLKEKEHLWQSKKPSKHALELAFYTGTLAISERSGMLKTYDLMTRHFGWDRPPKPASAGEVATYLLDRALRAQGVVSLDSICHLDAPSKAAVRRTIEARVRKKELLAVALAGAGKQEHWVRPEALETAGEGGAGDEVPCASDADCGDGTICDADILTCVPGERSCEELADEVIAKLDEYYPDDEAVGFSEGDLRGWIWVEAPTS